MDDLGYNADIKGDAPSGVGEIVPENVAYSEPSGNSKTIGRNELRIAQGIEQSFGTNKGYHVHVIKSRDVVNAEFFFTKVSRLLNLHGYTISKVDIDGLKSQELPETADSTVAYAVEESTLKSFLGEKIRSMESPVRYLISNSVLGKIKNLVLVLIVSDQFYFHLNMENFNAEEKKERLEKDISKSETSYNYKKENNTGFILIGLAFLTSAVNNIFGAYFVAFFGIQTDTLAISALIMLLTVMGITTRALTFASESTVSRLATEIGIMEYVGFFALGILFLYPSILGNLLFNLSVLTGNSRYLDLITLVLLLVPLSKYSLILGLNHGRLPIYLALAGTAILAYAVLIVNNLLPPPFFNVAVAPTFLIPYYSLGFGLPTYYLPPFVNQYFYLVNYIPFSGNILLALSYFQSYRFKIK